MCCAWLTNGYEYLCVIPRLIPYYKQRGSFRLIRIPHRLIPLLMPYCPFNAGIVDRLIPIPILVLNRGSHLIRILQNGPEAEALV